MRRGGERGPAALAGAGIAVVASPAAPLWLPLRLLPVVIGPIVLAASAPDRPLCPSRISRIGV
jgi:hypothetical protein